ncbi:MAG: hypothetical protein Q4B54_04700 [Coriobacteriales bacterium]|nr:hypothetical protein [Coriobacteriales bacterium]
MSRQHALEYGRGSGGELEGKMRALRSSSAMTFNLLGNGPVTIAGGCGLPPGTYDVEFEHQLPTLAGNPRPANLDAKLEVPGGDAVIFCEMKLAEWILGKAGGLRAQYLGVGNYLVPEEPASQFCQVFASLCAGAEAAGGKLAPRLGRYDAFQMLKHLLAIYSEMHRRAGSGESLPKRCVLLNCVWEMEHPERLGRYEAKYRALEAEEHAQYLEFEKASRPLAGLFSGLGVDFSVAYLSFAQMMGCLELQPCHREALGRYVV